jgi:hypothetical protein
MIENEKFNKELKKVINLKGYESLLIKFGLKYIISPTQAKILLENQKEKPDNITFITKIGTNKNNYNIIIGK